MKIESQGTIYRLGLDGEAILTVAQSLVYTGRTALAIQLLSSSLYSQQEANRYVSKLMADMAQATLQTEANRAVEPADVVQPAPETKENK